MSIDIRRLIEELTLDEGLRLKAYDCTAGKRTIGVGRNFEDVPFSKDECLSLFGTTSISYINADKILSSRGISNAQSDMLLQNDINKCIAQLQKQSFWESVKDDNDRARAIINLCFNLGINGLLGFKNTLAFIEKKDWKNAAKNLTLSKWYTQVGNRGPRIVKLIDPTFYDAAPVTKPATAAKPAVVKPKKK
jgi:lysozyme